MNCKIDNSKNLNFNIYEIRINEELINDNSKISVFLFNCKCVIFIIDITNKNSFDLIKKLLNVIEINKSPNLKILFIQNKKDLESQRRINSNEIEELFKESNLFENLEISLKTGYNMDNLIIKINSAINELKSKFPCDSIYESTEKNISLINYYGSLSFF